MVVDLLSDGTALDCSKLSWFAERFRATDSDTDAQLATRVAIVSDIVGPTSQEPLLQGQHGYYRWLCDAHGRRIAGSADQYTAAQSEEAADQLQQLERDLMRLQHIHLDPIVQTLGAPGSTWSELEIAAGRVTRAAANGDALDSLATDASAIAQYWQAAQGALLSARSVVALAKYFSPKISIENALAQIVPALRLDQVGASARGSRIEQAYQALCQAVETVPVALSADAARAAPAFDVEILGTIAWPSPPDPSLIRSQYWNTWQTRTLNRLNRRDSQFEPTWIDLYSYATPDPFRKLFESAWLQNTPSAWTQVILGTYDSAPETAPPWCAIAAALFLDLPSVARALARALRAIFAEVWSVPLNAPSANDSAFTLVVPSRAGSAIWDLPPPRGGTAISVQRGDLKRFARVYNSISADPDEALTRQLRSLTLLVEIDDGPNAVNEVSRTPLDVLRTIVDQEFLSNWERATQAWVTTRTPPTPPGRTSVSMLVAQSIDEALSRLAAADARPRPA
jgi:hypothetical protein